ncbi:MAG: hypothetical protein ACREAC_28050, partial [Blastocatellia bacterium]
MLTVTDAAHRLSFDVPDEMPMSYSSSKLEGMWWLPTETSRYNLVISNMSGASVPVTLSPSGKAQGAVNQPLSLTLTPHQVRVLGLADIVGSGLAPAAALGSVGGIRIIHSGQPGSVLAYGMTSEDDTGFSSRFPFVDPTMSVSNSLSATHIMIGTPDVEGLPQDSVFSATAILRNTSAAPITVSPVYGFDKDGSPKSVALQPIDLAPNQVLALDLERALRNSGTRAPAVNAGLTLNYTGAPGSLVAHLTTADQTRDFAFDVPFKDALMIMNRRSGFYPWDISGDRRAVVHVRNSTDKTAKFVMQIDFAGGSYTLPVMKLAPQQEAAVDLRGLRDGHVKDSMGRTIPEDVTTGLAMWFEHNAQQLTGRLETFSLASATASSFSCGISCCGPFIDQVLLDPSSFVIDPDNFLYTTIAELDRDACGNLYGPFDFTSQTDWTTLDATIATTGFDGSGKGCKLTGVKSGQTYLMETFQIPVLEDASTCTLAEDTITPQQQVTVNGTITLSASFQGPADISSGSATATANVQITSTFPVPDGTKVTVLMSPVTGGANFTPQTATIFTSTQIPQSEPLTFSVDSSTPTKSYTFQFQIQNMSDLSAYMIEPTGGTTTANLSVTKGKLTVSQANAPNGQVNQINYRFTIQASGGTGGNSWSVINKSLPLGISLTSASDGSGNGLLSGIPLRAGSYG